MVVLQILELLHPSVKVFLCPPPQSVEEMLARARVIDQSLESSKPRFPFTDKKQTPYTSSKPRPQERSNENEQSKPVDKKTPQCKHCPGQFHWYRECPKLLNIHGIDKNSFLPRINVSVGDINSTALLDTGAYPNFIDKSLLVQDSKVQPAENECVLAIAGTKSKVVGSVVQSVTVGTDTYTDEFLVIESLSEPLILGGPFLKKKNCLMDFGSNCLIFGNQGRERIYFLGYEPRTTREKFVVNPELVTHDFLNELEDQLLSLLQKYSFLFDTNKRLGQTNATKPIEGTENWERLLPPNRLESDNPPKCSLKLISAKDMKTEEITDEIKKDLENRETMIPPWIYKVPELEVVLKTIENSTESNRLIVPPSMVTTIIKSCHDDEQSPWHQRDNPKNKGEVRVEKHVQGCS